MRNSSITILFFWIVFVIVHFGCLNAQSFMQGQVITFSVGNSFQKPSLSTNSFVTSKLVSSVNFGVTSHGEKGISGNNHFVTLGASILISKLRTNTAINFGPHTSSDFSKGATRISYINLPIGITSYFNKTNSKFKVLYGISFSVNPFLENEFTFISTYIHENNSWNMKSFSKVERFGKVFFLAGLDFSNVKILESKLQLGVRLHFNIFNEHIQSGYFELREEINDVINKEFVEWENNGNFVGFNISYVLKKNKTNPINLSSCE